MREKLQGSQLAEGADMQEDCSSKAAQVMTTVGQAAVAHRKGPELKEGTSHGLWLFTVSLCPSPLLPLCLYHCDLDLLEG